MIGSAAWGFRQYLVPPLFSPRYYARPSTKVDFLLLRSKVHILHVYRTANGAGLRYLYCVNCKAFQSPQRSLTLQRRHWARQEKPDKIAATGTVIKGEPGSQRT